MTPYTPPKRRHLASSPFAPDVEEPIETYAAGDRVSHDLYGLGSVVSADASAVIVDFGARAIRVERPFRKMEKL